jgi:hypothetical protein
LANLEPRLVQLQPPFLLQQPTAPAQISQTSIAHAQISQTSIAPAQISQTALAADWQPANALEQPSSIAHAQILRAAPTTDWQSADPSAVIVASGKKKHAVNSFCFFVCVFFFPAFFQIFVQN